MSNPTTSEPSPGHMGEGELYDFVIIGSGFGGSVSAMRLAEKGYSVLVLERGMRFEDDDFPKTNWHLRKYLWMPGIGLRWFFNCIRRAI